MPKILERDYSAPDLRLLVLRVQKEREQDYDEERLLMEATQEQCFQGPPGLPAPGMNVIRFRTHQEQLEGSIASGV
jgi:hypothetical protein